MRSRRVWEWSDANIWSKWETLLILDREWTSFEGIQRKQTVQLFSLLGETSLRKAEKTPQNTWTVPCDIQDNRCSGVHACLPLRFLRCNVSNTFPSINGATVVCLCRSLYQPRPQDCGMLQPQCGLCAWIHVWHLRSCRKQVLPSDRLGLEHISSMSQTKGSPQIFSNCHLNDPAYLLLCYTSLTFKPPPLCCFPHLDQERFRRSVEPLWWPCMSPQPLMCETAMWSLQQLIIELVRYVCHRSPQLPFTRFQNQLSRESDPKIVITNFHPVPCPHWKPSLTPVDIVK